MSMTYASTLAAFFLFPVAAIADGPKNLDFENDTLGDAPTGWVVPTKGYKAAVMNKGAKEGEQFVRLSGGKDADRAPFGNLLQSIDATPYRGKSIQLRAAVRSRAADNSRVQMWLRVDRPNRQMGFFDNMGDRPITGKKWKYYEINGKVADDAVGITFGFMLIVEGGVDIDDVSFKVPDSKGSSADAPRPISDRGLQNLVAATRLLGYVRYFHPSPESADADWNEFAINCMRTAEDARSPDELASRLGDVFHPIAPTVRVYATGNKPEVPAELKMPAAASKIRVARWDHHGLGPTKPNPQSIYSSKIEIKKVRDGKLPEGFADPADPFIAELGGGVSCMIPLSLYVTSDKTKKQSDDDNDAATPKTYSADDRATRLADVALAWIVYQHFYPYFDVVKTDWPAALKNAIKKAATDRDDRALLDTLRELVARSHDGHGNVSQGVMVNLSLPLLWTWVGDELVVLCARPGIKDAPHAGDVVEKIDGQPVDRLRREKENLISAATPAWLHWRTLSALSLGDPGSTCELSIRSPDGNRRVVRLQRIDSGEPLAETRPEKIAEIKPGVFYIDISRINDNDFAEATKSLAAARGLIFDFRGYPGNLGFGWINHLITKPATSPQWHVPHVLLPDRVDFIFEQSPGWPLAPVEPRFKAKCAFLIDGRAISYAESCMGIVENYKLGEIVGQPTAGTNGNVNIINLPGGFNIYWTGMKVLKHNGARHHGVGIRPTIPVSPTIEGITAGRDEILERAMEVVSK